jgi:hypothetical protein
VQKLDIGSLMPACQINELNSDGLVSFLDKNNGPLPLVNILFFMTVIYALAVL